MPGVGTRNKHQIKELLLAVLVIAVVPAASAATPEAPAGPPWGELGEFLEDSVGSAALLRFNPVVRSIAFRRDNVFSPDEPESGRFYARIANALHWVTAERVVRRGLYFQEGDTLRVSDLAASLRRLRAYPFLHSGVRAGVTGRKDSADVCIRTRDVWSTRPEISFLRHGRLISWMAGLREGNLAGLGKDIRFEIGRTERRTYWTAGYGDQQLLGSPLTLLASVSHGADIDGRYASLVRPRDRVQVPWALDAEATRYRGVVADHRGGLQGPEYRGDLRTLDIEAGPRLLSRAPRALWLMPALHIDESRYAPAADFEGWRAGPAGLGTEGPSERLRERTIRAPGIAIGFLAERFSLGSGIETLQRWEDVSLGVDARLMIGASMRALGSDRDAVYWQLNGMHGVRLGARRFALLGARGYGLVSRGRTSETRASATVRYYDRLSSRQTLAARLTGERAHDLAPQDLPMMGAERGLRGFDAYRFWGERLLLVNLEDRLLLVRDFHGLVSAGAAAFLDGGMAWSAGGHRSARPRLSAGVGLRLQGSRNGHDVVTRIDLAHPVAGDGPGDGWVVTVASGQAF